MKRQCQVCHHLFNPVELAREVSKNIETERKKTGVDGILFRVYACSACGHENLFVDLHPLEGETDEEFHHRKEELEVAIAELPQPAVEVSVIERQPPTRPSRFA